MMECRIRDIKKLSYGFKGHAVFSDFYSDWQHVDFYFDEVGTVLADVTDFERDLLILEVKRLGVLTNEQSN